MKAPDFHVLWRLVCAYGLAVTAPSPGVCAQVAAVSPIRLTCEMRDNPLGIGEIHPRLGWKLAASDPAARGLRQSAYQILVASSLEILSAGGGDLWNTGKVASDQTQQIEYAGRTVAPRQQCWWAVRVWDQTDAVSEWSAPAHWSRGLLDQADWSAQWIGRDAPSSGDGGALTDDQHQRARTTLRWVRAPLEPSKNGPQSIFVRKSFHLPVDRPVRQASFWVIPDQVGVISLNGRSVGETTRWARARQFNVTAFLVPGENVMGVHLVQEDGYPPAALGELEVSFAAGPSLRIPIDATWLHSIQAGEGWNRQGFDVAAWAPVAHIPNNRSPWNSPQNATHALTPAPYVRKEFQNAKPIRRATVYATALGVYELRLNGRRVGQDHLAPGWTDFHRRVQYQTYDVTALMRSGANAIGAIVGDGWFASTLSGTGRRYVYGAFPRLRVQLEIEYADGTRATIATDSSWRASFGAVLYADLLQGCGYDARREWRGWDEPGFDDTQWGPVAVGVKPVVPGGAAPLPRQIVEAATLDPVRAIEELPGVAVTRPRPEAYVIDFGQNLVGWVRFKVRGRSGQKLTLRHAEMLNPNGTIYTSNLRGAAATDEFWLRGGGEETLEPKFTFHGFRYVEVSGLEFPPVPGDWRGVVVHQPLTRTGEFSCSDPRLNQLFHNIVWGQKGNYLEVPTDCPQRDERMGWTGDTQFFVRTGAFNFDTQAFMERWLVTLIEDSQAADGTFADVSPIVSGRGRTSSAWGDAAILCTHALWLHYGDTRVIERHFAALTRYMSFLEARSVDGIVNVGGYGDWLHLGGSAKPEVIDTAYYAHLCRQMKEMARAIGRPREVERFAALEATVKKAFHREFLQPDGSVKESSQTGYALAFTMDLVPAALMQPAADRFVESIKAHDWHLATGFIGTPRLLPALHSAGRDDVAYRLLQEDRYPSWLYPVKLGATTMWERWDGWTPERGFQDLTMNSFNHYAFGAVGEFLYRQVAGIDTDGPGFRRVVIRPRPGGTLTRARATYDAPSGRIESAWRQEPNQLKLDVTIPPNATARIHVPAASSARVREGGYLATESPGVKLLDTLPGEVVFGVGSGVYKFAVSRSASP